MIKYFHRITSVIAVLACAGAIVYASLYNSRSFPAWITWETKQVQDSSGQYEIIIKDKTLSLLYRNGLIWASSPDVKVQDAVFCDIDNNGEEELLLLCWKKGRYGRHKPFWVEEDETSWSQHIFLYTYSAKGTRPKWMSSYIGQDVAAMRITNADSEANASNTANTANPDTLPPLSPSSSVNRLWLTAPDGENSAWKWDSWGFTKENVSVTFTVFGDNLIHEPIYRYAQKHGTTYAFLFENVLDAISQSDVAIINQETPFTEYPSQYSGYPRFATPLPVGEAIANAGFDVVTCATNHALDLGATGVHTTKSFFEENGILCLGIQYAEEKEEQPYEILTRNGIRFALFNYTYGTNGIQMPPENPHMVHLLEDEAVIRQDIENAKAESDFIIIFVHWGTENSPRPDESQQEWANIFLDCQADIVVGTHPHTLQPYTVLTDEHGHEMLLYYSIGNYISAQSERACIKGGMATFTVSLTPDGYTLTQYSLTPLTITWQEGGKYVVGINDS